MLKLTIEGENLSELTTNVNALAADLNGGGGTVVDIASTGEPKKVKKETVKKLDLAAVQDAMTKFQDAATDKKKGRDAVKELLARYSVKSSTELPEAEYADFLTDLAELA